MTALTLFVEKGYYDTKITDIAAAVPMSTGLMFHYFESKEELSLSAGVPAKQLEKIPADVFLTGFLTKVFAYAKEEPWVFNMFVLMGQVRRSGMPEEAHKTALAVDSIEFTSALISRGQKDGIFREGDATLLARCFWASVQGIMEEMAMDKSMPAPDPSWIVAMLKA